MTTRVSVICQETPGHINKYGEAGNLTPSESRGFKKLKKRVEAKDIVMWEVLCG